MRKMEDGTPPYLRGWELLVESRGIRHLGLICGIFEGCMYTFVFLWTPALLENPHISKDQVPYGMIFALFMVGIMIGSCIFTTLSDVYSWDLTSILLFVLMGGFVSHFTAALFCTRNTFCTLAAFIAFEICCGIYFPVIALLKARVVPEQVRMTIYNYYRIPLNVIVVGLLGQDNRVSVDLMATSILIVLSIFLLLTGEFGSFGGAIPMKGKGTPDMMLERRHSSKSMISREIESDKESHKERERESLLEKYHEFHKEKEIYDEATEQDLRRVEYVIFHSSKVLRRCVTASCFIMGV